MTIPEFIQKWNVAFESKEEEAEFAAEMEADIKSLISSRPEPDESGADPNDILAPYHLHPIPDDELAVWYRHEDAVKAMRQFAAQEVSRALVAKDEYIINLMDNFGYETGVLESALTAANKRIAELENQIKSARNQGRRDHAEAMESDY